MQDVLLPASFSPQFAPSSKRTCFPGSKGASASTVSSRRSARDRRALSSTRKRRRFVAEWQCLRDLLRVDEPMASRPPRRAPGGGAGAHRAAGRRIRAGDADTGPFGDAVRAHVRMTGGREAPDREPEVPRRRGLVSRLRNSDHDLGGLTPPGIVAPPRNASAIPRRRAFPRRRDPTRSRSRHFGDGH